MLISWGIVKRLKIGQSATKILYNDLSCINKEDKLIKIMNYQKRFGNKFLKYLNLILFKTTII